MSLPPAYFAGMYAGNEDPWGFRTRWYEQRKRDLTLAALPSSSYRSAFEAGCSIGELTTRLAPRCERLVAADVDPTAVAACRAAVRASAHVDVRRLEVPREWPDGTFDLVVLSEVGYYLDATDLRSLLDLAVGSLADGGHLLACHWRHPVTDYPQTGDAVHEQVRRLPGLCHAVRHEEEDFVLDVLTRGPVPSPARREGLVT